MIKSIHLRSLIIKPALLEIDMYSKSAENLLMGTVAQESSMGYYLKQKNGPALGIFQVEPGTFDDIVFRYLNKRIDLKEKIFSACNISDDIKHERLAWDLRLSTIICRIRYFMNPDPLPDHDDIKSLAKYWKKHYNTEIGRGTVSEFIDNYKKYVRK